MAFNIIHVTTSLGVGAAYGGAETMLCRLIARIDPSRFRLTVVSLRELGPLTPQVEAAGIPVWSLGMRPGRPNPLPILRLARWLRRQRPCALHTWMYHADLVGGLAAKLAGGIPVAWALHHSNLNPAVNKPTTMSTIRACAKVSGWLPKRIICSSMAAQRAHAGIGYAAEKMVFIPNGADLSAFRRDPEAQRSVRQELLIPESAPIVGIVGRFHPHKDHENFIRAAGKVHRTRPDVHFILCGADATWENGELTRWMDEAGVTQVCRLLGIRSDVSRLTASFDVAASSSVAESFSVSIVEAMSCEVPCVVTDVGDSGMIVGETGRVVPPRNPDALAAELEAVLALDGQARRQLGQAARRRIAENFDLPSTVKKYESIYEGLAQHVWH